MYSYGSPHMAAQKQDDQLERTFSSYVKIQVVVLKTYLGRWTIGRSGERGSGISVLPARYDDDDALFGCQENTFRFKYKLLKFCSNILFYRPYCHILHKIITVFRGFSDGHGVVSDRLYRLYFQLILYQSDVLILLIYSVVRKILSDLSINC